MGEDLYELFKNIPFGNSEYMIKKFVLAKEGNARVYRQCLLEYNKKYKALKEAEFRRRYLNWYVPKLKLLARIIPLTPLLVFLDRKKHLLMVEDMLIHDAIQEVKAYEAALRQCKQYTREEFEAEEHGYYKTKFLKAAQKDVLSRASGINAGLLESAEKVFGDEMDIEQFVVDVVGNTDGNVKLMEEGRQNMLNSGDDVK